jgi:hypothetical protein
LDEQRKKITNLSRVFGFIGGSVGILLIVLSGNAQPASQRYQIITTLGIVLAALGIALGLVFPKHYSSIEKYFRNRMNPESSGASSLLVELGEACLEMAACLLVVWLGVIILSRNLQLSFSLLAWVFVLGLPGIDLIIFSSILSLSELPSVTIDGVRCPQCGRPLHELGPTENVSDRDVSFCSVECAHKFRRQLWLTKASRLIIEVLSAILLFGGNSIWFIALFTPYLKDWVCVGISLHILGIFLSPLGRSISLLLTKRPVLRQ